MKLQGEVFRMRLVDRIKKHYRPRIGFYELAMLVFPRDAYPDAWNYSSNGGPPALVRTFSKGLKAAGFMRFNDRVVRMD